MKSGLKKILFIAFILLLLVVYFVFFVRKVSFDVTNADSLTIQIRPESGYPSFSDTITGEDLETLKRILGTGTGVVGDSSCFCVGVDLIFSAGGEPIVLYPAGDDSDSVRFEHNGGDYYFHIGAENKAILQSILEKYGVIWPFGI